MDIRELLNKSREFKKSLDEKKIELAPSEFGWYPYGTLDNFFLIEKLLSSTNRDISALVGSMPVADIGAADGDSAFFLESLGFDAHIVDFPPTNFNGCRGSQLLKQALSSRVEIHQVDLDKHFELPGERYGLALFLGILYHLKNPFGVLEQLAKRAHYLLISTRVTRFNRPKVADVSSDTNQQRVDMQSVPCAYLVSPSETNNDPTNYWIFSEAGLRRILDRTGWDVLDFMTVGNTKDSDPASSAGDERAFCLVRSRHF
jgi:tRNA (mo5U34)-methyltransferase